MNGHVYRTIAEQFGEQAALSLCLQMLFRWLTAACSITLVTAHQAPTKGKRAWRNMLLWLSALIGSAAYAYVQNEATFLRLSSLCLLYAGLVGAVYLLFERSLADSLISAAAGLLTAYLSDETTRTLYDLIPFRFPAALSFYGAAEEGIRCVLIVLLVVFLVNLLHRKAEQIPLWMWGVMLALMIGVLSREWFQTSAIIEMVSDVENPYQALFLRISQTIRELLEPLAALLLCGTALLIRYIRQGKEILQEQIMQQKQELISMQQDYQRFAALRHDFRNHLLCLQSLLSQNETEKAADYLKTLTKEHLSDTSGIQSSSAVVNAVIHAKCSEAEQGGIRFSCQITAAIPEAMEYDVSIILCNLLDNALDACRTQTGHPEIRLSIAEEDGYDRILVKNTIPSSVLSRNPQLLTSKPDAMQHGIGLRTVRSLTEAYEGILDFYEEGEWFAACVMLMR